MKILRVSYVVVSIVWLLTFVINADATDVRVKGSTLKAVQQGSPDSYSYSALPNVRIKAYRNGPIFKTPKHSDGNGEFVFPVTEGAPFKLLFYLDQNTVPEMQNLAGKSGIRHEFHVGLVTVQEYLTLEKQGRVTSLAKKLQMLLDQLPQEDEVASMIRSMLDKLRG